MSEPLTRYPMEMAPAFKDYIWGGTALAVRYGKASPYDRTAESWELSCHPAGPSKIANGVYAGMSLPELTEKFGEAAVGAHAARFPMFPVLIKLIDANGNLSIQVHPDDAYALSHEHEYGKTEMWYIVDAAPGAFIYYGFSRAVTQEEFARRIAENSLTEVLRKVPVQKGESYLIPSGTLHAIGKGCLIAEIQQNSNLTYRVYDYGRLGADGKPRELHVEKAKAVTRLCPADPQPEYPVRREGGCTAHVLASCAYFTVELLQAAGKAALTAGEESFQAPLCVEGSFTLRQGSHVLPLTEGKTVFLPAGTGDYTLEGTGTVLLTRV